MSETIQEYRPCMKRLMLAIGSRMSKDPERWIERTYISKQSSLYDFGLDEDMMQTIASDLQLALDDERLLGNMADQMVKRGDPNEV